MKVFLFVTLLIFNTVANEIEINIIYGNHKPDKMFFTTYEEGNTTALELLKQVSQVVTSKTGPFTFVRSIDSVESKVGKFGWFYLIDGHSVTTMAENYILKNEKSMIWVYKAEVCY